MDEIDERAHRNLVDFTRWVARLEPGAPVLDEDGVLVVVGHTDWPSSRVAVPWGDQLAPAEWVDAADAFLGRHGTFGCAFARVGQDDALHDELVERGWTQYGTTPEMVRAERLADQAPPDGTAVVIADRPDQITGYATVTGQAFAHLGFLEGPTVRQLDRPQDLLADDVVVAVAEQAGEVVAGAMVVLLDGGRSGYVAWVSCADAARGQGLGDAVTRAVTNAAFDRGCDLVTLEASSFGANTYRRMGYEDRYEYHIMIRNGTA